LKNLLFFLSFFEKYNILEIFTQNFKSFGEKLVKLFVARSCSAPSELITYLLIMLTENLQSTVKKHECNQNKRKKRISTRQKKKKMYSTDLESMT